MHARLLGAFVDGSDRAKLGAIVRDGAIVGADAGDIHLDLAEGGM